MFAEILVILLGAFVGFTMILSPVQPWVDHSTHHLLHLVGACFLTTSLATAARLAHNRLIEKKRS